MADEPENLTLRLLQELRSRFDGFERKLDGLDERFSELKQSVDGNTMVFNLVAGATLHHEERIKSLEERQPSA